MPEATALQKLQKRLMDLRVSDPKTTEFIEAIYLTAIYESVGWITTIPDGAQEETQMQEFMDFVHGKLKSAMDLYPALREQKETH